MGSTAQTLTVLGEPIPCDRAGCDEPAAVYLRELDPDDEHAFGVCYCEQHWQAARRAFAPMTAHDAAVAVREASAVLGE